MKNFVVSDIHDHYDLLMEALNRNDFDINNVDHRHQEDHLQKKRDQGKHRAIFLTLEELRLLFGKRIVITVILRL